MSTNKALEAKAQIRGLAQGVRVFAVEEGHRYVCPSAKEEGKAYELIVRNGNIDSCSCAGFEFTNMCKHYGMLAFRLEAEEKLRSRSE